MTTNTQNSAEITQQIENQENELKDLLSRVIKSPLKPLETQITQLEKRLESVEDISKATSVVNLPALQAAIRIQGEESQKNFKGLRKAITEELPELLTACLASMPQEMARLHEGQVNQTNEITNLTAAAAQASEKTVIQITESREHIEKTISNMQADGRVEMQQLGTGMVAIVGSLNRTSAQVTDLAPTLIGRTDELGSRLESVFTSFRKQSEKDRNEMSIALQMMQKRFLWLSAICGLSFAGSAGLLVSRLVLHV